MTDSSVSEMTHTSAPLQFSDDRLEILPSPEEGRAFFEKINWIKTPGNIHACPAFVICVVLSYITIVSSEAQVYSLFVNQSS